MQHPGFSNEYSFNSAVPVWQENKENVMNHSIILRAVITDKKSVSLAVAAHSRYQIFVNGAFFAAGPARAAHGFFRVDEYSLEAGLDKKENIISLIAAGYNINSFYLTNQPPFVCAEIKDENGVLFATGSENDFEYTEYAGRVQKVLRFSYQRPFTENYIYDACYDFFMTQPCGGFKTVKTVPAGEKKFIERFVPYCDYRVLKAAEIVSRGIMLPAKNPEKYTDRSFNDINEKLLGYKENELESCVVNELYSYETQLLETESLAFEPVKLGTNCTAVYDMGVNSSGFIRLSLTAEHDCVIYAVFSETLPESGVPRAGAFGCVSAVKWALQGGRAYDLVSFEPYTFRYIQIISMYAPTLITNVSQYREAFPEKRLTGLIKMPTQALQKVYDAAVETFVQNATDIYMDCPSRERAGWLCDSFFTSRVEKELSGDSAVEHNFLENFLLPQSFDFMPKGMLPMCYPSDHYDGAYIHNWAMWFALELLEYTKRSGDGSFAAAAKEKLYALYDFTCGYENADGLIQDMGSWIFIEWSKANDYVLDVSYPSNMLYAAFLDTLSELYSDKALSEKAGKLRETIIEQSFDGEFFRDNAVLDENGELKLTNNRSETCQYYAFFTRTATKERFGELYEKLLNEFGPARKNSGKYPDIPESNAFIGNYLRLNMLFADKKYDKLIKEIEEFFLPMSEKTGTLWENMTDTASCCHGFASYAAYLLNKATESTQA